MSARFLRPFFVVALLLCGMHLSSVEAQDTTAPVSNATPRDFQSISAALLTLETTARKGDANALAYYGATPPADSSPLQISSRITHVAVSPAGALVRQAFGISIQRAFPVSLAAGTQELWLARAADGSFTLTATRFVAPPDALAQLQQSIESERVDNGPEILDVVASRVGGRWIALRRQQWTGAVNVQSPDANMTPRDFLFRQMNRAPRSRGVTAHFLFSNTGNKGASWLGMGSAFNSPKGGSSQLDTLASSWRDRMASRDYTFASSHREFARSLFGVGLWNEGADELRKAALLDPTTVTANELSDAEKNRTRDPQNAVMRQLQDEQNVGLGADHPVYLINALQMQQRNQPSALGALRIALEYSRLAQDARAENWTNQAIDLQNRGAFRPGDSAWMQLLFDHLRERAKLSKVKPSAILRSQLFTVRAWPNDPQIVTLLAALEEAQHTVYADFGIPMGNTEILLWHNQPEFARYTTQFSEQGGSEFVAALTLTKLVTTRNGPLVLGEEVNTFSDTTDTQPLFGTLAHEYGHVAVRQLSKGRMVPVWFNEGIATSCEGGYEGYLSRVRRSANAGTLLSMEEMLDWNVDGERAFLAYSQANSILDFIVAKWGKNAVLDILRQIGNDTPPEDAFRNVLGVGQNELWNQWAREGIR
ncbi:hypothetical protein IAD21_06180 [Abditibacteriota bacterium]|nr:hypothetical protein IAD21_06180 [Abditibacteriota bacterium]